MQKIYKIIILMIMILFIFFINCYADDVVCISELIENSIKLDGNEIVVQGEVIGEELERGEYSWININDGTGAIGIWIKNDNLPYISCYGDYKHKGDIVNIEGVFYRDCTEHGGDVDIHCTNIKIVDQGFYVKEEISIVKIIITVALTALMALTILLCVVKTKTSK